MSNVQSLILSVQGERAERLGARREHTFDCRDGSIGRSDECDWVLGADGVSRLHALVRYLNGLYFIEDRSTNGMLLNGASLRRGEPATLKHGDCLQIDTFEIDVRLQGEAATQWSALGDDGRAVADTVSPVVGAASSASMFEAQSAPKAAPVKPAPADALDLSLLLAPRRGEAAGHDGDGLIPDAAPGASLDPLAMFDAPSSYDDAPSRHEPPAESWNHTPAVSDRFRPPQVEAMRTSAPVLPDDWDMTGSRVVARVEPVRRDESIVPEVGVPSMPSIQPIQPIQPERAVVVPPAPVAAPIEVEPASLIDAPPQAATPHVVPPQQQSAPASAVDAASASAAIPASTSTSTSAPASTPIPTAAFAPVTASFPAPAPASAPASGSGSGSGSGSTPTPASASASASASTAALQPQSVPAPQASPPSPDLEDMFRIAVDAMMDVLRARAELKNSFRLPATLIQRTENNPLKFAPTAQEAVKRLFAPPDQGFLAGSAALHDAAADIRNHQMAMLAGVRSAFHSLLEHFDPARIEEAEGGSPRRLSLGGRPRHWERYKAQFEALTRDPDDCFRRLFGDEFARAYEEQLVRLKSRRD
ncbi:type VI secretion system-associated FHA domain protein TagH [Burkholderia sp. 22PA0106]|uniref:type VI secretion system-associated FHA domain protein TagH n=1 Tax=Burkholderia sp. 22PA0106 TaxID=3237371 RepID=UPI0039C2C22D